MYLVVYIIQRHSLIYMMLATCIFWEMWYLFFILSNFEWTHIHFNINFHTTLLVLWLFYRTCFLFWWVSSYYIIFLFLHFNRLTLISLIRNIFIHHFILLEHWPRYTKLVYRSILKKNWTKFRRQLVVLPIQLNKRLLEYVPRKQA